MSVYMIGMECGMHIPLDGDLSTAKPPCRVQLDLTEGQHTGKSLTLENGAIHPLTDENKTSLASLEGQLPRRSLIWTASGIWEVGRGWRWEPSSTQSQAPWLDAVHHSWPSHAPRWMMKAPMVLVTANALPIANRTRHQRDLARLWLGAEAALVYLGDSARDTWQMHQHCDDKQLAGAILSSTSSRQVLPKESDALALAS